jgi:hypothetical protein
MMMKKMRTPSCVMLLVALISVESAAAECSAKACEDPEDPWGTGVYASPSDKWSPAGERTQQGFGIPEICAASKLELPGVDGKKEKGKCFASNHFDAVNTCENAGARLCTADELKNDETHGSGCNYDFEWVWSSTECELTCSSGSTIGYRAYPGFSGAAPDDSELCLSPLESEVAVVRCCRDSWCSSDCSFAESPSDCPPMTDKEVFVPDGGGDGSEDACTSGLEDNKCKCSEGFNAIDCASLGTAVGSQSESGSGYCLVVDCGGKGLKQLPSNIPSDTTKLDLQNNPGLTRLSTLKHLGSLEWLYIQNVPITTIAGGTFGSKDAWNSNLGSLKTLEISLTDVVSFTREAFEGLPNVKTLTFADNGELRSIDDGIWAQMPYLESLNLLSLKNIDLTQSNFEGMASLKDFTAKNCKGIKEIPRDLFRYSGNLEEIAFEFNEDLTSVATDAFRGAGSVKKLNLIDLKRYTNFEGNPTPFEGLTGLTDLVIKATTGGLTRLRSGAFSGLDRLERVELNLDELVAARKAFSLTTQTSKV